MLAHLLAIMMGVVLEAVSTRYRVNRGAQSDGAGAPLLE